MKIIAALLFLLAGAACAEAFIAQVIVVLDGDTVMVLHDKKKTTVRLAAIDAPEKLQPYGPASRNALAALVLRKEVRITTTAIDDYGRVVGLLQVGNINVNAEQLRRGWAWEYSRYHADKALIALQPEAQQARRGLWAGANPLTPWAFRKTHAPTRDQGALGTACGKKHYCSQMVSCDEAKFYFTQCRVNTLDKNNNGVPCENLCRPKVGD